MLELTDGQREKIRELQKLADEAKDGDRGALLSLRVALRQNAPEVVARCSDTATNYRGLLLAKTAGGGNSLVREAILERARLMTVELVGEGPTPLEVLLSERVASSWVLVELQEALGARHGTTGTRWARPHPRLCSRWPACRKPRTADTYRP